MLPSSFSSLCLKVQDSCPLESKTWDQQPGRVWFLGCCSALLRVCLLRNLCNKLEVILAAGWIRTTGAVSGPYLMWVSEEKRHTWAMGRKVRVHPFAAATCYGGRGLARGVGYIIRMRALYTATCEGVCILFVEYLLILGRICYQTSWYTSVQTFLSSDLYCYNSFLLMAFLFLYKQCALDASFWNC